MFEDIQALEQEVKAFRNNILASQELVLGIDKMVKAINTQSEDYSKSYENVLGKLKSYADMQKTEFEAQLAEIEKTNVIQLGLAVKHIEDILPVIKAQEEEYRKACEQTLEQLRSYSENQQTESEAQLSEMNKKNEAIINGAVEKLTLAQKEYITRIDEVEPALKKNEDELNTKYQQFITKLEATNIDQIYSSVQDLKKSINLKLTILLSGVGVSIVLAIAAIILK